MVHIDPRHVRDCDCEDYPCCGHTDNIPSDEPYECDLCFTQHDPSANCPPDWEDEDDEEEELVTLTQLTALVEPINDALDNLLEDILMENIIDLMKEQEIGTGDFEADQTIAEQIHARCVEVIGERFKKT